MVENVLTIEDIRRYRAEIESLAAKRRVRNVRIFGSVAKGTASRDSGVDFLVDADPDCSYFDLAGLYADLETLLQHKVDVVTPNAVHWFIRDEVLQEAISL